MMEFLSSKEQFLLKEYDAGEARINRFVMLRHKLLISFTLTSALAGVAMAWLANTQGDTPIISRPRLLLAFLYLFLSGIGVMVVIIFAKLRRKETELQPVINEIRKYFIKKDDAMWKTLQQLDKTQSIPNMKSRAYFGCLIIKSFASMFFTLSLNLFFSDFSLLSSLVIFLLFVVLQHILYFRLVEPRSPQEYSRINPTTVRG